MSATEKMWRAAARIGGEARDTGRWEAVRSPWDQAVVGEVAVGGEREVEDAIAAAVAAAAAMAELPAHRRRALLEATARAIGERAEELARLIARESGKPIRLARGEVARAVTTFTLAAAETSRAVGEVLPADVDPRGEGRLALTMRVPRGPVAAISPFNFPLNLVAHKVAPAIAAGAPVVLKAPPQAPLTAHLLGELLEAAGLPPGGLNVVHAPPEAAQRMVEDPRIKVLSFTGSDTVGWRLKGLAGKKQVLLELGGNAPCILDAGCDLAAALPAVVGGAWGYAGQVCIKVQRLFVHASLWEEVLAGFVQATEMLVVGDPLDEDTVVGPLIEARHAERVVSWIKEAVAGGAVLHTGGEARGQLVMPTVLTNVDPSARVWREEVFGPVTVLEPFDDFARAIDRCNQTRFGLQAGVFTPRLDHALLAFRRLAYGGVVVNDVPTFRLDNLPYGGTKDSGLGREGLRSAMEELTEPRTLVLR